MDKHPLIIPLRLAVLCLLGACLSLWYPEIGMVVVATGFGWWKGCACCGTTGLCSGCSPSYSSDIQVDISGVADSTHCACTSLNNSYTLAYSEFVSSPPSSCFWSYTIDAAWADPCSGSCSCFSGTRTLAITLTLYTPGPVLDVNINTFCNSGANDIYFRKTYGATPDCSVWSAESISYDSTDSSPCNGTPFDLLCDGSSAVCEVTAT